MDRLTAFAREDLGIDDEVPVNGAGSSTVTFAGLSLLRPLNLSFVILSSPIRFEHEIICRFPDYADLRR